MEEEKKDNSRIELRQEELRRVAGDIPQQLYWWSIIVNVVIAAALVIIAMIHLF